MRRSPRPPPLYSPYYRRLSQNSISSWLENRSVQGCEVPQAAKPALHKLRSLACSAQRAVSRAKLSSSSRRIEIAPAGQISDRSFRSGRKQMERQYKKNRTRILLAGEQWSDASRANAESESTVTVDPSTNLTRQCWMQQRGKALERSHAVHRRCH